MRILTAALALAMLTGSAAHAAAPAQTPTGPAPYTDRQLLDRAAIDALGVEYFYRLDHGLAETLPELFTADGVQDFNDGTTPLQGREAIRAYYQKRSKANVTRHVVTNLRVTFEGRDKAQVVRTFTHYIGTPPGPMPAVPSVREYQETVVRGKDGRWLFSARKVIPVFDRMTGAK